MDCGPSVVAHVHGDCRTDGRVRLTLRLDRLGRGVKSLCPQRETANMADDPILRRARLRSQIPRMLITDGDSPIAEPLAKQALTRRGAGFCRRRAILALGTQPRGVGCDA